MPEQAARSHALKIIRHCLRVTGLAPTTLAKKAGVAPSTVNRFLGAPETHPVPNTTTLTKLTEFARRFEQAPGQNSIDDPAYRGSLSTVRVLGEVRAGAWLEAIEWAPDQQFEIEVPYSDEYRGARRYGVRVSGDSMNLEYPDGSIVICVHFEEINETPRPGDHVITHQVRTDGRTEATIKELVRDEQGRLWLWPRSSNPEHQTPIQLPPDGRLNGHSIEIKGLVIGAYRPRRRTP